MTTSFRAFQSLWSLPKSLWAGVITLVLVAGCSSDDLAKMENDFPDLSDLPSAPVEVADSSERQSLIEALLEEAESRKDEGYQAPE